MTRASDKPIKIRDARNQTFFWIDKRFIENGYSAKIGPYGVGVFAVFCYYANPEGKCWPSQTTIARLLGCSVDSVIRAIQKLRDAGLISSEFIENEGKQFTVYTIINLPANREVTPS